MGGKIVRQRLARLSREGSHQTWLTYRLVGRNYVFCYWITTWCSVYHYTLVSYPTTLGLYTPKFSRVPPTHYSKAPLVPSPPSKSPLHSTRRSLPSSISPQRLEPLLRQKQAIARTRLALPHHNCPDRLPCDRVRDIDGCSARGLVGWVVEICADGGVDAVWGCVFERAVGVLDVCVGSEFAGEGAGVGAFGAGEGGGDGEEEGGEEGCWEGVHGG